MEFLVPKLLEKPVEQEFNNAINKVSTALDDFYNSLIDYIPEGMQVEFNLGCIWIKKHNDSICYSWEREIYASISLDSNQKTFYDKATPEIMVSLFPLIQIFSNVDIKKLGGKTVITINKVNGVKYG